MGFHKVLYWAPGILQAIMFTKAAFESMTSVNEPKEKIECVELISRQTRCSQMVVYITVSFWLY